MNGCRWQEKSFNVTVKEDKPLARCKCGVHLSIIYFIYNGEPLCQQCFSEKKSITQKLGINDLGFYTPKDKLYEFIDNKNFRHPIEVRSKGHWKKLLKQHGLTDDFDQRPKKPEDLKNLADEHTPSNFKFYRDEILRELQEKGLRHKLVRRR